MVHTFIKSVTIKNDSDTCECCGRSLVEDPARLEITSKEGTYFLDLCGTCADKMMIAVDQLTPGADECKHEVSTFKTDSADQTVKVHKCPKCGHELYTLGDGSAFCSGCNVPYNVVCEVPVQIVRDLLEDEA